jgi:hypothetical protein
MFVVVGPRNVCGFAPGSRVNGVDLVGGNIDHLIAAGHIAKVSTAQTEKESTEGDVVVEEQLS